MTTDLSLRAQTLKSSPGVTWASEIAELAVQNENTLVNVVTGLGFGGHECPERQAVLGVLALVAADIATVDRPTRRKRLTEALRRASATLGVAFNDVLDLVSRSSKLEMVLTQAAADEAPHDWDHESL